MIWGKSYKIMTVILAFIIMAGLSFAAKATNDAPPSPTIHEITSKGGLSAWLIQSDELPLVSLSFVVKQAGNGYVTPAQTGLPALLAATLDEGAGPYPSSEFRKQLEDYSLSLSFAADVQNMSGQLRFLNRYRDKAAQLFTLAINQPRFDEDALARIKAQMIAGLKARETNPNHMAQRALYEHLFGQSGYGLPEDGTAESLAQISAADLAAYWQSHAVKDAITIGIAGDISKAEAGALIDQIFGDLPQSAPAGQPDKPAPHAAKFTSTDIHKELAIPQAALRFALPGVEIGDPDYFAAQILNYLFGGGSFESLLMQEIRDKRGLAYSAYSYIYPLEGAPLLLGGVGTRAEAAGQSLDLIKSLIADSRTLPFSPKQVEAAKTYIIGSYVLGLSDSRAVAARLASLQAYGLPANYLQIRPDLIKRVTLDDLKRVATRLMRPDLLVSVTVGPPL